MNSRRFLFYVMAAMMIALSTLGVAAQQAPRAANDGSRTPWGEPNLQGIWSAGTITPMQRPARFANKPVLTPEEAAAYHDEVNNRPGGPYGRDAAPRPGDTGAYNEIFSEWGGETAQELDRRRTSLIIDPPNGRLPAYSPTGVKRENAYRAWLRTLATGVSAYPPLYNTIRMGYDATDPESRGPIERCFGEPMPAETGPATFVRIVQSPGAVTIFLDRHQGKSAGARTINVGKKSHLPTHIRLVHGDSIGWWEGNTLVIDTTNFTVKTDYYGSRENLHLIERLTRTSDAQVIYQVTIEDPTTWTRPWTYEIGWTRRPDKQNMIYEQSCHEGNFGIIGLLAGRRHQERLHAQGQAPDPNLLNKEGGRGLPEIAPDGTLPQDQGRVPPRAAE